MKKMVWLILTLLLLAACQQKSGSITILADGKVYSFKSTQRLPEKLLASAGVSLEPDDRLLFLGETTPFDNVLPDATSYTLEVRRAVNMTIISPDGNKTVHTSAQTVGQALTEAGYSLYSNDRINPPSDTSITGDLVVNYQPGRDFLVTVDKTQVKVRSSAATVGQVLAEAGVPLVGLDKSQPDVSAPVPKDGKIRVVRVVESVALTQKTIPFNTRTELSADLEIDQQALLQGGEPGLSITRVRTRSEDGAQVSQQKESEIVVRPQQDRILGIGTKIVIRKATVDGVTIEYWRALNLRATSYSPCRSATPDGRCNYGTSSGLPVKKGVVAMVYSWYLLFAYEQVYIPGYGKAVVGDVGGIGTHYWIDLGWSDADYQPMEFDSVTVYFLTPVPANPGYILP
jgi:uncharacterized protein YabE (DUF348 family)